MPKYAAPVSDFRFILSEVLEIETFGDLPGFEDVNTALINAILDEAGKFTSEVIAPLNQVGDKEGCTHHTDGSVVTPPGFKEAYDKYCEAGWGTLNQPKEFGGQGLPNVLAFALKEMMSSLTRDCLRLSMFNLGGCITVSWRWMHRQGCLMFIGLGGALPRLLNQKSLS